MNNLTATSIILYTEILAIEQRLRARLNQVLPSGMEISHLSLLNHLVATQGECTPIQLAKALNVTKGAMTNTLSRLEKFGYINVRTDWEDARRKFVSISQSGRLSRNMAIEATTPIFEELSSLLNESEMRLLTGQLRHLRQSISEK